MFCRRSVRWLVLIVESLSSLNLVIDVLILYAFENGALTTYVTFLLCLPPWFILILR